MFYFKFIHYFHLLIGFLHQKELLPIGKAALRQSYNRSEVQKHHPFPIHPFRGLDDHIQHPNRDQNQPDFN